MKKYKFVIVLFMAIVALLTTGCGNKKAKLSCTQNASGVDIYFNVGFMGNTIKSIDIDYDMDLSTYSDLQINVIGKQDFCTTVKNAMSQYKNAFTDCNQDIVDKHLKVHSELDINKIAKNTLGKMTSPKKAKKELESQGYTCSIK